MSAGLDPAAGHAGDVLVLTGPLGTGIAAAAVAAGGAPPGLEAQAAEARATSPDAALAAAAQAGVVCGAVVGERGLLGHLAALTAASGVGAVVRVDRVPVLDGAVASAARHQPAALAANRAGDGAAVDVHPQVTPEAVALLWDPQEGGALVLAVPAEGLRPLLVALGGRGVRGHSIGQLIAEPVARVGVVTPVDRIGASGGGSQTAAVEAPEGVPPSPGAPASA